MAKELGYLKSTIRLFEYYKQLGEKSMTQLTDEQLFAQPNADSNSIATIVKHLWGNMLSRWTEFLTTDGEKEWRERDAEFDNDLTSREDMMKKWEEGWQCLLNTINSLTEEDLDRTVYIRNEGHSVVDAINRQLAHYSSHIGQIIYAAKLLKNGGWESLSIPKGGSGEYNKEKFAQEKGERHFTNEWLDKK